LGDRDSGGGQVSASIQIQQEENQMVLLERDLDAIGE
jgi:hypothetical protein